MPIRPSTFTGIKFENPFLLSSAPPTESESNILRAFEAGWGGVVVKTIGLHPVVNVVGARTKFLRTTPDDNYVSMKKRPGAALHWLVELGAHLRQVARLVGAAHSAHQGSVSDARPDRVDHGRLGQRQGATQLADARRRLSGRRRRRSRAQLLVSAHGPERHGLEHRQGRGPLLGRDRGCEGSREGSGVDASSRRRRRTSSSKRRRASAAAPMRSFRRTRSRRCR